MQGKRRFAGYKPHKKMRTRKKSPKLVPLTDNDCDSNSERYVIEDEQEETECSINLSDISSKDLPNMNTFCDWLFETIVISVYDSFFINYISIVSLSFIVCNSQSQRLFIYRGRWRPDISSNDAEWISSLDSELNS